MALTALTVLFGMQSLRVLMPLGVFMLRDRFGWHATSVALAMMAVLATSFLAASVRREAGPQRCLLIAAGGLGLARLELQAWTGEPLVDLGLAVVAAIFFFVALPALAGGGSFVMGWLVGLTVDTALHTAYGTWDMAWRSDLPTLVAVLALVVVQWWLLAGLARDAAEEANSGRLLTAWSWFAFGPLLFLELLVLGNVARLATLTGWSVELAALWVLTGRILALAAAILFATRGRLGRPVTALLALMLVGSLLWAWPRGPVAALQLLAAQVLTAVLWSKLISSAGTGRAEKRLSAGHGFGLLAFGALLFLYYAGFDVSLPFSRDLVPPAAAFGLGVLAITGTCRVPIIDPRLGRGGLLAAAALWVLPLIKLVAAPQVQASSAAGLPFKVMTYNLHLGIDPRGHLALEHLAATIEAEDPDVVALQEVFRGWVLTGSADALGWLSRRLGMHYAFASTADPLWGNAVLSRRPILSFQALDLPPEDLLVRRGFLAARIDLGAGEPLEVIVAHHHHFRDGGAVRELQSRAILDFWGGRDRTVIAGDFNGRPGEPEIEMLRDAGLADVLDLAGIEPGYTHPSNRPDKRIDYLWISPDLAASEVSVPSSLASDHLPVVATVA